MSFFSVLFKLLRPAQAKTHVFTDVAAFREYVMTAIRRQPGVRNVEADVDDPAKFKATVGGRPLTGDVTNIFGYLTAYPDEDTEAVVARFASSLAQVNAAAVDKKDVVVVVRNREYIASLLGMGLDVLHEPLGGDLVTIYMADRPDSMSPIKLADLPGEDLTSIRTAALDNVRRWLPKVVSDDGLGSGTLYYVQDNTMLSTSLLLLDEFWLSIAKRFPGDVLIALPRKDQLFIFDDGNPAARLRAQRLIDVTFQENFNLLSPALYARRGGKIVVASR